MSPRKQLRSGAILAELCRDAPLWGVAPAGVDASSGACLAEPRAIVSRNPMKLTHRLLVLILCGVAGFAPAQTPPAEIFESVFTMNVHSGTGLYAQSGEYVIITADETAQYKLYGGTGVAPATGTYSYTSGTGAQATVTIVDSIVGRASGIVLNFETDDSGTYSLANSYGTQTGSFSWRRHFTQVALRGLGLGKPVVTKNSDGTLSMVLTVKESANLVQWGAAGAGVFEVLSPTQVCWTTTPAAAQRFFVIEVDVP